MAIKQARLQKLYKTDAVARAILDEMADGGDQEPEVETLAALCANAAPLKRLTPRKRALAIIKALKAIQETGCGTFILGRKGHSSRMRWEIEPDEVHALAKGAGETLVALDIATLPDALDDARERDAATIPNLETCVRFFASTKAWSAPALAAARAGLWEDDVPPPMWQERLDRLERALEDVKA